MLISFICAFIYGCSGSPSLPAVFLEFRRHTGCSLAAQCADFSLRACGLLLLLNVGSRCRASVRTAPRLSNCGWWAPGTNSVVVVPLTKLPTSHTLHVGSSWTEDRRQCPLYCEWIPNHWTTRKALDADFQDVLNLARYP